MKVPKGFTLIEVIVASLMGTIVVSAALAGVVQLGQSERDERVLSQADSELNRVATLINREISEAAYVYTGSQLVDRADSLDGLIAFLDIDGYNPDSPGTNSLTPVLALWKSESLPYPDSGSNGVPSIQDCDESGIEVTQVECRETSNERRAFTLVVYLLDTRTNGDYEGPAAIRRFQARKYTAVSRTPPTLTPNALGTCTAVVPGTSTAETQDCFPDPLKDSRFQNWPYADDGTDNGAGTLTIDSDSAPILVDYIDDPTNNVFTTANTPLLQCNEQDVGVGDASAAGIFENFYTGQYRPSPIRKSDFGATGTVLPGTNSFFACVRIVDNVAGEGNQDVVVYIRGNPDGRSGFRANDLTALPISRTQRVTRGTIDKRTF